MKVLIVHAHPERRSFSGGMTDTAVRTLEAAGHEVRVSDLYEMKFDPVSDRRNFKHKKDADYYKQQIEELYATETDSFSDDVAAEIEKVRWCDVLIFQFPLWWFGLPGILKGWVDKVFAMGVSYGPNHRYETGLFRGRVALCALTTGGGADSYLPDGPHGDVVNVLAPINVGMFQFVGFDVLPPFVVYAPVRSSEEERKQHLQRYADYISRIATTQPLYQFSKAPVS